MEILDKSGKKSFTQRIRTSCEKWKEIMEPVLEKRKRMLAAYCSDYFKSGSGTDHPVNLIDRGISTMVPWLTMNNPAIEVETHGHPNLRPIAYRQQLAINYWMEDVGFADQILARGVFNSMFGMGIFLTGVAKKKDVVWRGHALEVGYPFIEVIDDSMYVCDPFAVKRSSAEFEGHLYPLSVKYAKEFFGGKYADAITSETRILEGSPDTVTKSGEPVTSIRDICYFMDVYLPDEKSVITLFPFKDGPILKTTPYEGPDEGPYNILGYKFVSDHPIPIPPVWGWLDLDTTANVILQKMRQQAERQKDVILYTDDAAEDATRIKNSEDGDLIRCDNPAQVRKESFGGSNPVNYQWVEYCERGVSKNGGNLDLLGGVGGQSDTFGQDRMQMGNASKIVNYMANRTHSEAHSMLRKIMTYIWRNPFTDIRTSMNIKGIGKIPVEFNKTLKSGEIYDYAMKVVPYSMQRMSPDQAQQVMLNLLNGWVLPTLSLAARQGQQLDVKRITEKLGQLSQIDTDEFFVETTPTDVDLGAYAPNQASNATGEKGRGNMKAPPGAQGDNRFGATMMSRQENSKARTGEANAPVR
jgi:hypothetical protein